MDSEVTCGDAGGGDGEDGEGRGKTGGGGGGGGVSMAALSSTRMKNPLVLLVIEIDYTDLGFRVPKRGFSYYDTRNVIIVIFLFCPFVINIYV